MRGLHLDYLRGFVDVIELGSFSAAAERARLTQPAISLQVRRLEDQLGVRLIERVGRKPRPTAAGTELLDHARQIDAVVAAALDAMARHATGKMGRVRLGSSASACIHLLPPMLRDLRRRFPTLDITVTTGNSLEITRAVDQGILDLALVTMPAAGRMLEVTPVLEDELVVIAPPTMRLPAPLTAAALSKLPVLLSEPGGNTRRLVDRWFARSRQTLKPAMSLDNVEAIRKLVHAELGCAVIPAIAVRRASERRQLAVCSLSPRLSRTLAVVIRRDRQLTPGMRETHRALLALAASAA